MSCTILSDDPQEQRNLIDEHPKEALRLASASGNHFRQIPTQTVKGVQVEYEMSSASVE